jgi:hypothetical protein
MNKALITQIAETREYVFMVFQRYLSIRPDASSIWQGKLRVARIRQTLDVCRRQQALHLQGICEIENLAELDKRWLLSLSARLTETVRRIETKIVAIETEVEMASRMFTRQAA